MVGYHLLLPELQSRYHLLPNGSTFCIMNSPRVIQVYPLMLCGEMGLVNPKDTRSCLLLHLIFCPRCILNSSLIFLERVRWSICLPSFLYDLFILYIVLYAVLGDIPLMLNIPDNIIKISLPVHTFDFIPHPSVCASMASKIDLLYSFEFIFRGLPGLTLSYLASRPLRCILDSQL